MKVDTLRDFLGNEISHGTFFIRAKKRGHGYTMELGLAVLDPKTNKMKYHAVDPHDGHTAMKVPFGRSCIIVDDDDINRTHFESVIKFVKYKYKL